MSAAPTPRPKHYRPYYDLNLAHLPAAGLVSIFHRVSGALLFFPILPSLLCFMYLSLGSEAGFEQVHGWFAHPLVKFAAIGVVWLYAHHFFAGIRYLLLDLHWGIEKSAARTSSFVVWVLGALATVLVAWRLW
ncbi:MAG TPA: succinate dehydrogenase, cytochrome b556 subunit [Usitatibacter sp.]|jgi:succinate dehydrogenase / fumarate reductase cytochrome b subunit